MKIILGSSSPRRKHLLSQIVNSFEVMTPDIDETPLAEETALCYANRISQKKAEALLQKLDPDLRPFLLLTCDTVVSLNDLIIGKPKGFGEAVDILYKLSGKTHQVISSITLFYRNNGETINTAAETSDITFKSIDRDDCEQYLKRINFSDKAGAYAIQEHGDLLVREAKGSMSNIIGFPQRLFFKMLTDSDILEEVVFGRDGKLIDKIL